MSSKKKLIISLSVAAAVLVAAIIAIVAVFAATAQSVQNGIIVRFEAGEDISCQIVGDWALEGASEAEGQKGKIGETLIITADEETSTHDLSANDIEVKLSKSQNYVDFNYQITNIGSTAFTVKLAQAKTQDDVSVTYWVDGTGISATDIVNTGTTIAAKGETGASKKLTVRVEVPSDKLGNDVTFEADILWKLDVVTTTPEA